MIEGPIDQESPRGRAAEYCIRLCTTDDSSLLTLCSEREDRSVGTRQTYLYVERRKCGATSQAADMTADGLLLLHTAGYRSKAAASTYRMY